MALVEGSTSISSSIVHTSDIKALCADDKLTK